MNQNKPKVLIMLMNFNGGGAERVVMNLLNHYDRTQYTIKVCIIEYRGPYLKFISPDDLIFPQSAMGKVDTGKENKLRGIWHALQVVLLYLLPMQYRAIKRYKPDVVMSVTGSMHYTTLLWKITGVIGKNTRWIARIGNHLSSEVNSFSNPILRKAQSLLCRFMLKKADGVISISQGVHDDVIGNWNVPSLEGKAIYNPLDIDTIVKKSDKENMLSSTQPYVLGVGRLVRQKRFDRLIRAYHQSELQVKGYNLVIVGVGDDLHDLQELSASLGIEDQVIFAGFIENPFPIMKNASLFVLSSDWEGFGNVVAEALICGTPTIVTDCPYGPSEIVEHNKSGIVVERSTEKLANAIRACLVDESIDLQGLSDQAKKRAETFRVGRVCQDYLHFFDEIRTRK